jgi:trehalose/maltose hydrolase-like predicted phosphorylase
MRVGSGSTWMLVYDRFEPAQEGLREALCTLGNGYVGVRGAAAEVTASRIHYPGMYIAGVYDTLPTHVSGRTIYNEDLVNCPNWLFLTFRVGDGPWFTPSTARILSYRQELDMKNGVLSRRIRVQDREGRRTYIHTHRIVSMADPHMGAVCYQIEPENYSGWITVRSMLDGSVLNTGVERYRQLSNKHWKPGSIGNFGRNGVYLSMQTVQSGVEVAEAATLRLFSDDKEQRPLISPLMKSRERISQEIRLFVWEKQTYRIEKVVSFYTSRDSGVTDPVQSALSSLRTPPRFTDLLEAHRKAWAPLWKKFDIQIDGDSFSQRVLRLHMFHLLQTASMHNRNIDAGFPARGLHGEAYRGHVFWDELFAMPVYDLHMPEISQALLMYRYNRLDSAREYARADAYSGAMFPWQSGSTGNEETQTVHLNPMSGEWGPDFSRLQRHVSLAIAYNVWNHWLHDGNDEFMYRYGAEMIYSIALFFSSLVKYDESDGRYHTYGIMGPDEFHEQLPGSDRHGLDDNAYTNVLISWLMTNALRLKQDLPREHRSRLEQALGVSDEEYARWQEISRKMNLIINEDGIISQFKGYFELKELDWAGYRAEYGNIHRMDRILKAEGHSPDDYKVAKQADVMMMFYLFPLSTIEEIFNRLGYRMDLDILRRNYDYYVNRTSHGSTLSRVVHCYIAELLDRRQEAWSWLQDVLKSDIEDIQGGTTPEGIHTGVMGGSIDILIRGYAGIQMKDDRIVCAPRLPEQWKKLWFRLLYRGRWLNVELSHTEATVVLQKDSQSKQPLTLEIGGQEYQLLPGKPVSAVLSV